VGSVMVLVQDTASHDVILPGAQWACQGWALLVQRHAPFLA
jgi:hypothetical protein